MLHVALTLNYSLPMAEPITCNFVRGAIRHFTIKYETKRNKLPKGSYARIMRDYNQHIVDNVALKTTYSTVSKKFLPVTRKFGSKWHPSAAKREFLDKFSLQSWANVDQEEKSKHTLHGCKVCKEKYQSLSESFPLASRREKVTTKSPQICFSPEDLSTPTQFGSKITY